MYFDFMLLSLENNYYQVIWQKYLYFTYHCLYIIYVIVYMCIMTYD